MCGRYQLDADPRTLRHLAPGSRTYTGPFTGNRLINIPPGTNVPAIFRDADRTWLEPFFWGLTKSTPQWLKRWANIRSETVEKRGAERRCLVPATAFYEWEKPPHGSKQPWMIRWRESSALMLFAGIWDEWETQGRRIRTMAILTCPPNALMAQIHHRQPVILNELQGKQWLERMDPTLFTPVHRGRLEAVPVSTTINKPENNDRRFVERVRLKRPPLW